MSTAVHPDGNYVRPIGGARVTANPTPYSEALICLGEYARRYGIRAPRIAVGRVNDMTGQLDQNGGRPVTQGAMLMAITALGKAGIPLVERYETDVSKLEYALANNKLISDKSAPSENGDRDYEPVRPGAVSSADFFLTGGITELNNNIETNSVGVTGANASHNATASLIGANRYILNIGLDLRLVNTRSLDIVDIVSYQKQIVGRQVGAGVYAFFGNNVININASNSAEEPMHLAIRSLIERAVFEMVSNIYRLPSQSYCLNPANDALATNTVTDTRY